MRKYYYTINCRFEFEWGKYVFTKYSNKLLVSGYLNNPHHDEEVFLLNSYNVSIKYEVTYRNRYSANLNIINYNCLFYDMVHPHQEYQLHINRLINKHNTHFSYIMVAILVPLA